MFGKNHRRFSRIKTSQKASVEEAEVNRDKRRRWGEEISDDGQRKSTSMLEERTRTFPKQKRLEKN